MAAFWPHSWLWGQLLDSATPAELATPDALPALGSHLIYILTARNFDSSYERVTRQLGELTDTSDDTPGIAQASCFRANICILKGLLTWGVGSVGSVGATAISAHDSRPACDTAAR
jgi:hypothetical protein